MPQQSPINLNLENDISHSHESFVISWEPFDAKLEDNGYLIRVYGNAGHIIFKKQQFNFVEFHFHTPSEHLINGQNFPMEIHFVHYNQDVNQFLVLGVLIEEAQKSLELQKVIEALSYINQNYSFNINPRNLLPKEISKLHYSGSLTTPPCTENVSWHIYYKPNQASKEQIDAIRSLRDNNNREIQNLDNRDLIWVK